MDDYKRIREARKSQTQYWDANLDPDNQSGSSDNKVDFDAELPFYLCPDQRTALDEMQPLQDKFMLEIGAGLGMNARWCCAAGARVVATDISQERLSALRNLPPGRTTTTKPTHPLLCVRAKAEALPFRRDVFELEYVKAVLIHTELEQASREMERVLSDTGKVVIVEPMDANPFVNLYRKTLAPKIWQSITIYFSPREIQTLKRTFSNAVEHRFYLFSFLAFVFQFAVRMPECFRFFHSLLGAVDRCLFRIFPFLKRYAWFVLVTGGKNRTDRSTTKE
ncbi:MAG: class I SAM-dependent methyltransferase [Candidatus Sumerlaeales bacterium]|nr:class I SAM-dependent methyltransferase [Candidatus Sumerlaeales bacterium]